MRTPQTESLNLFERTLKLINGRSSKVCRQNFFRVLGEIEKLHQNAVTLWIAWTLKFFWRQVDRFCCKLVVFCTSPYAFLVCKVAKMPCEKGNATAFWALPSALAKTNPQRFNILPRKNHEVVHTNYQRHSNEFSPFLHCFLSVLFKKVAKCAACSNLSTFPQRLITLLPVEYFSNSTAVCASARKIAAFS